ncbi:MAG: hypothetical protein IBX47_09765 [Desulfuromonadales bacterium]|nr:hypothetical protein [Desulfuromonadales bacterium]
MKKWSENKFSRQLLEGIISISLVLIFFFIIMSVLNFFFPSGGQVLLFMQNEKLEQVNATVKREYDLSLSRGGQNEPVGAGKEWAARVVATNNTVKSKRSVDIAWKKADPGMRLYNQDAVQTLDRSTALIRFDDQNEIDIGENSLIVIRRMEQDLIFKEKRSYMVVVDGELRGRIGGAQDDGVYLEVTTPNSVTRLQNSTKSEAPLEFLINVEAESGSTITLFSGEAEVEAQGEIVILEQNQMTRITGTNAPSAPVSSPKMVQQLYPADGQVFCYRDLPPRLQMRWQTSIDLTQYHLQLARDRQFSNLILDERLNESTFAHGNLSAGDYFWRISGLKNESEGRFSPIRRFRLIQDQDPPFLEVDFPVQPITTTSTELTGKSEPGSQIFISGVKITCDDNGLFNYTLPISRGTNVVIVEAVDQAGNASFSSKIINGVY